MKPKICLWMACHFLLAAAATFGQKGKDGAKSYTTAGTYILNRYTPLAASVAAGATSITVSNIASLNGSTSFTNSVNPYPTDALTVGDLILIVQVQGVTIGTSNTNTYGTIASYNNTGNFEVKYVLGVAGNTINFCTGLANAYSEAGTARTEVIRVPRLSSLTVGAGVTLTGSAWSGAAGTGGVVALEVSGNITLNGSISANAIGFNGGTDPDGNTSSNPGNGVITIYRTTVTNNSAGKGESVAGTVADYAAMLGANGRGAPGNAGGGGNGHDAGGGGGANAGPAGVLAPWDGTGLKNTSTAAWANAWNLEAAGFATSTSTGGGRGGYSYSFSDQDALTMGTSINNWSGDYRDNVGGFGGHPLNYNGNTRLFMGGGGGAGDGNNNAQGNGGNGGGIAYILCNGSISGSGILSANGQDGFATNGSFNDGSGGGGGGGAIQALVNGTITGISLLANGGAGGSQGFVTTEADGPGGGGGGGYIATTATAITPQVNGGANGTTASTSLTEFLPNGATMGNTGATATKAFADVEDCAALLQVQWVSVSAAVTDSGNVSLNWVIAGQNLNKYFTIERSVDGIVFTALGTADAGPASWYAFSDRQLPAAASTLFYRIRQTDFDGKYSWSGVVSVTVAARNATLTVAPNPVRESMQVSYFSPETGIVRVGIFNLSGIPVRTLTIPVGRGNNNFIINELNQLPPAQYILRIQNSREVLNKTFIVH